MNVWHVDIIARSYFGENTTIGEYGDWVCKRPIGFKTIGERIYWAWRVFIGRDDVLVWSKTKGGIEQ